MGRKAVLFLWIISIFLLGGCWSKKELTDIAIVSALGIDKNEKGEFVVTFQIINPNNVAGGLQGGMGGSQAPTIAVYSGTGSNIVDISRRAAAEISRYPYYAHASLVVIEEKVAREGIEEVLDVLERDTEFRQTTRLIIAKGSSAREIVEVLTPIDRVPASKVNKSIKFSGENWGGHLAVDIRETIYNLTTPGKEVLLPGFTIKGSAKKGKDIKTLSQSAPEAILSANGIALFKGDKLVGWMDDREARGVVWILGKMKETNIAVDWKGKEDVISYQLLRSSVKSTINMQGGEPMISVEIKSGGDIGQASVDSKLTDRDVRKKVEDKVSRDIEKIVKQSFKEAQKQGTDIFGFGEKLYRSHPEEWEKVKEGWNKQYFTKAKITVKAEARILRTGHKRNPFLTESK